MALRWELFTRPVAAIGTIRTPSCPAFAAGRGPHGRSEHAASRLGAKWGAVVPVG